MEFKDDIKKITDAFNKLKWWHLGLYAILEGISNYISIEIWESLDLDEQKSLSYDFLMWKGDCQN